MRVKKPNFEKILKLNRIIFPYLIGLSFFFLGIESCTYIGFLRKFILVDSRYFLFFSIVSIILLFYSRINKKNYTSSSLERLALDSNALLFLPIIIFYWIMTVLNATKYLNYVFVNFHIQPQNFLNIVFLSLSLFVLRFCKLSTDKNKIVLGQIKEKFLVFKKNTLLEAILYFASLILLILFVAPNIENIILTIVNNDVYVLFHLTNNYDQKMRSQWGFYYDYMKFINDNTSRGSTIVVPPQENPWLTSGNSGLDRYFVYPKYIISGAINSLPGKDFDYVLIDRGEWYVTDPTHHDWPKIFVPAEEILYIDPLTLKVTRMYKDFYPSDPENKNAWGLIKVDKERLSEI